MEKGCGQRRGFEGSPLYFIHQRRQHLFITLADADHNPGLGDPALFLDAPEQLQRAVKLGRWGGSAGYMRPDRLQIVINDVRAAASNNHLKGYCQFPSKSGMSTSMDMSGQASLLRTIVSAQIAAPPSLSSSRLTLVITTCLRPIRARFLGNPPGLILVDRAGAAGSLDVAEAAGPGAGVAQDHDRKDPPSPTFAQGPILGHPASSHTVCSCALDIPPAAADNRSPQGTRCMEPCGGFCGLKRVSPWPPHQESC